MTTKPLADGQIQAQLDRLVTGELAESDRRSILAWLDEDAGRWRMCALAFLETQMWERAVGLGQEESLSTAEIQPSPSPSLPRTARRDRSQISILALTVVVAVAFTGGLLFAQWLPSGASRRLLTIAEQPVLPNDGARRADRPSDQPLIATVSVRTNLDPSLPLTLQMPVAPQSVGSTATATSPLSDYERKQWEKLGFEVVEELRYLPARLPDGRDVVVPVNKVQVKFKGIPVS